MKEDVRAKYNSALSELIELLKKRQQEIEQNASILVEKLRAPAYSLIELKEKISVCLKTKPSEKYNKALMDVSNLIDEFNRVSTTLQSDNIPQSINKMKLEYETMWKGTVCERFMKEDHRSRANP